MADDEPAITALVAGMLGFAGFRVVQAHGGGEALPGLVRGHLGAHARQQQA